MQTFSGTNINDIVDTHDGYRVNFKVRAEEDGYPDAPVFLEYEQRKMQRTIIMTTTARGIVYYALLMDPTGALRLVQIKESEVPKYAGWVQPR